MVCDYSMEATSHFANILGRCIMMLMYNNVISDNIKRYS